jgi:hypothetical protein
LSIEFVLKFRQINVKFSNMFFKLRCTP